MSTDLSVLPKTLKWFHLDQNNSGGYFIQNDVVSEDVFVQAYNAEQATAIARNIVKDYSEYCECCGERWWECFDDSEGTEVPSRYGKSIYEEYKPFDSKGYATLHYLNGVVDYYPKNYSWK